MSAEYILKRWGAYMRKNGVDLGYPHVSPLHRDWSPGESQEVLDVDPELERVCAIVYAQPKKYRDILHWRFRDGVRYREIARLKEVKEWKARKDLNDAIKMVAGALNIQVKKD